MGSSPYTFKQFGSELFPEFISLFQTCFKKKKTIGQAEKLFGKGKALLGYMAFVDGQPVAFYGVIPVLFNIGGQQIKAAQSLSTMVHPLYRTDLVFLELAELTQELARISGFKFFFGWPNNPKLFNKILGWRFLHNMQKFQFSTPTLPLGKIAWKIPRLYNTYNVYFRSLCKQYEEAGILAHPPAFCEDEDNFVLRNVEYLRYKQALGSVFIQMCGKRIWINKDYRLKIGDMEHCNIGEFEEIIRNLKGLACLAGLNEIVFVVSDQSFWYRLLQQKFISTASLTTMYLPLEPDYNLESVSFTWGDYDTF
jgi:hypothetical protein